MRDSRIHYWYDKALGYKVERDAIATILLVSLVMNMWLVFEFITAAQ